MEKAHDISLDEPCVAHQAILFMLDVLMRNSSTTLTLDELYDSFGDKSFTPQMLRAVGGNEQGLRQFLIRYPSLFTVTGDSVSANSGGSQLPRISTTPERYLRKPKLTKNNSSPSTNTSDANGETSSSIDLINSSSSSSSSSSTPSGTLPNEPQYDSKTMKEIEQEAIAFFRKQISKREEDWLPIVSVAGHASQSSSDVRKFVGPQNEFKAFLVKYPHIFVVKEEYCGLKGKADVSTQPFPPPSPPPKRRLPTSINVLGGPGMSNSSMNGSVFNRTQSFKSTNRYSACANLMPSTSNSLTTSLINSQTLLNHAATNLNNNIINNNANSSNSSLAGSIAGGVINKPRLTPVEVKAVHYVMRILHKNGRMLLQTIPGLISRAPDQVSNIVGFTREDLIQFFKRHSAIFQLHPDGCVSVKQDAVKALILKDVSTVNGNGGFINSGLNGNNNPNTLNSGSNLDPNVPPGIITNNGVVLRIFPKYGILNMDNNEQVFFDIQSCQFETFSDLTTILHTGDQLHFNAIIGPRDGSTKWRSLKTWIKMKPQQSSSNNNMMGLLDNVSSHSDADKSDDSSTSSSHCNNRTHHLSLTNNIYQNNNHSNQQNGSYYIITGANLGQNGQVNPNLALASSPTTNINGSINSLSNINEDTISNVSTPTNILLANNNTGDFNQYQLEMLNQNSDTLSDSTISLTSSMSASNIVHSNSATNLQLNVNGGIINNNNHLDSTTSPTTFTSSKSIHSFSSVSDSNTKQKQIQDEKETVVKQVANITAGMGAITKFMKESSDNISKREISSTNSEMVSIGCQTISTGEVTVTNIYIE